jgi:hypothetical protein
MRVRSQKKAEGEACGKAIDRLFYITSYRRELTGIYGESESEHLVMTIGGYNALENPSRFTEEFNDFLASIPHVIEDAAGMREKANALFKRHVPIVNSRLTRQEATKAADESQRIHEQYEADRNAERDAFIAKWGINEQVAIPAGMMAVYLEITHDASDPQSDYYHSHAQIGYDLLLGIVPEGKRTEKIARGILARYPELSAHRWSWHREEYSMGSGTYLISEFTGIMMPKYSNSTEEVNTRFEIRFGTSARSMHPYMNYTGDKLPAVSAENSGAVTMTLNRQHNGVELRFGTKPGEEILNNLRANGFRWHGRRHMWYAKQAEKTLSLAERLSGTGPTLEEAPVIEVSELRPAANVSEYHEASDETEGIDNPPEAFSEPVLAVAPPVGFEKMPSEQLSMF